MYKVYLLKVKQGEWTRFVGRASARTLSNMSVMPDFGAAQEAQRPLEEKRLNEISKFVEDKKGGGMLSTSVVLGTRKKFNQEPKPINLDEDCQIYYVEFPETEAEFKNYKDSFDILDGQHRLFSFRDKYCKLSANEEFDLSFELYINPSLREKRLIFKNTNEKQKSVDKNYLLYLRSQLGMLDEAETKYYGAVQCLNEDQGSPLQDRIVLTGEKKKTSLKAQEIVKLFDKIDLKALLSKPYGTTDLEDDKIAKPIEIYLKAWEQEVGTTFAAKDSKYGSFFKISGLRYMIMLFPTFLNISIKQEKDFLSSFVREQIRKLYACGDLTITATEFFDSTSSYNRDDISHQAYWRGESATFSLAKKHASYLEEANSEGDIYNPFTKS